MAFTLYTDAGLTTALSGNIIIDAASEDVPLWLGSSTSGVKIQSATGTGVTNISISFTDSATGTAPASTICKLATTTGGLATASGGTALTVGTQVLGGVGNAFAFYLRVANPLTGVDSDTTLGLTTSNVIESTV
jgi:hypothetical protein